MYEYTGWKRFVMYIVGVWISFVTAQRQLGEAKQEAERERTKLSCTVEQLTTAQEHVAHLKEEVCISHHHQVYLFENATSQVNICNR